jgi:hypothetical protein
MTRRLKQFGYTGPVLAGRHLKTTVTTMIANPYKQPSLRRKCMRLFFTLLTGLFFVGVKSKASAQVTCEACILEAGYQSLIVIAQIQLGSINTDLGSAGTVYADEMAKPEEERSNTVLFNAAQEIERLNAIATELIRQIGEIQDSIDKLVHDGILICENCSNPVEECTCPPEETCPNCYQLASLCICSPPEETCPNCYQLASLCLCPPPEGTCPNCNQLVSQCSCPPPEGTCPNCNQLVSQCSCPPP